LYALKNGGCTGDLLIEIEEDGNIVIYFFLLGYNMLGISYWRTQTESKAQPL